MTAPQAGAREPLVELRGLTRRFGDVTAVDGVSLTIGRGEFFALLGPSGCGKTTLLRMLAGFETPDSGEILLAGEDISRVPPYRRPVNMMFQSYALFPHMSVEQNVAFGLKQDGLPKAAIAARVAEMLDLVQLRPLARRRPDQLSGGQRQRVALARSLAKRPKLLLLDEPLAALDKKLRQETQFELIHIQQELGITFVVVTHDQEEAMTMADRIAVMNQGRLVQVASPEDIYERPNSRFVAGFVGEVNLLAGEVRRVGRGMIEIASAEAGCTIEAEPPAGGVADGATVWFAVRPEKMRIARAAGARGGKNRTEGTVIDIAYLGDLSIYRVRLDTGTMLQASRTNSRRDDGGFGVGERVALAWTRDAGLVLTG